MSKVYAVLGAGSSAAIQAILLLLDQDDTEIIFGIGRNSFPSKEFSFGLENNPKFNYENIHLVKEFDKALALLDVIKPDVVINYAAQGETSVSWKNSWCYFETNCVMLSKLSEELSKRIWLQRFIHISTSGIYDYSEKPITEDYPLNPSNPYAVTKAAFDMYIQSMQSINNLPINILRTTTIYCPGQRLYKLIPRAIISGLKGEKLPLHGGGKIQKSYIHAKDLAKAILAIINNQAPFGKIYNVAPDNPIILKDIINIIAIQLGLTLDQLCKITEDRLLQDGGNWLDCSSLKKDTGWEISINLEQGIREVITWVKQNFKALRYSNTSYIFSE